MFIYYRKYKIKIFTLNDNPIHESPNNLMLSLFTGILDRPIYKNN